MGVEKDVDGMIDLFDGEMGTLVRSICIEWRAGGREEKTHIDPALLRYFDRLAQSFLLQTWLLSSRTKAVGLTVVRWRVAEYTIKVVVKTSEVDYR